MSKKLLAFLLSLSYILCFGQIANAKAKAVSPSITVNVLKYEVVNVQNMPQEIKDKLETLREKKGAYVFDGEKFSIPENYYYIFIGMGMKPTLGYSIGVTRVEDNEGKTVVYVNEISPAPGDITGQMVTYPFTVIKISKVGMVPNFVVRNNFGENYDVTLGYNNSTSNNIAFEVVNYDKMPAAFVNLSSNMLVQRGFRIYVEKSPKTGDVLSYYVLVQSGQKNTGGYSILPVSAQNINDSTLITMKETSPSSNEMSLDVISYPKFVIRLPGNISPNFIVKDIFGNNLNNLGVISDQVVIPGHDTNNDSDNVISVTGYLTKAAGNNLFVTVNNKQMKFKMSNSLFKSKAFKGYKWSGKVNIKYIVMKKEYVVQEISFVK